MNTGRALVLYEQPLSTALLAAVLVALYWLLLRDSEASVVRHIVRPLP